MRLAAGLCLTMLALAMAGCSTRPVPAAAEWDLSRLDTTADLPGVAAWERDLVVEINRLRSDPARYAELYVAPLAHRYLGRLLFYPGYPVTMTVEGAVTVAECREALRKAAPAPLLRVDAALELAAAAHVADTGPLGLLGHLGSDGSGPPDRVARVDPSLEGVSEAIHYGRGDARRIVLSLLLDDGVPGRGHRLGVLNPMARLAGAARGPHREYGTMTVIDFARTRHQLTRVITSS